MRRYIFKKTDRDFMGRQLSTDCWDGSGKHKFCTGWTSSKCVIRCECPCHDDGNHKPQKRGKCATLPLPDVGLIEIK